MIKLYYQQQQTFLNKFVFLMLGLVLSQHIYAIPAKDKQDERLQIVLNQNKQLCVYSSDENFYISAFSIQKKTLFRTNDEVHNVMTQIPTRNLLAGSGLGNCIVDKKFSELVEYNQPYHLTTGAFYARDKDVWDKVIGRKYTDFCVENKNQQIRLVGVKKQGNQFVCTDKDWQPYQPQKGFWSRLFGR